jgi:hypothetical protein
VLRGGRCCVLPRRRLPALAAACCLLLLLLPSRAEGQLDTRQVRGRSGMEGEEPQFAEVYAAQMDAAKSVLK